MSYLRSSVRRPQTPSTRSPFPRTAPSRLRLPQWARLPRPAAAVAALSMASALVLAPPSPALAGPPIPTKAQYTATIRSADGPVGVRAQATTRSALLRRVPTGTTLTVVCSTEGRGIAGTVRATSLWDRLTDGSYVSHAYIAESGFPSCDTPPGNPGNQRPRQTPAGGTHQERFIAAAVDGARRSHRDYGVPASVVIAQAIIESGWGHSGLASESHNLFGIKCINGRPGPLAVGCVEYRTMECRGGCAYTTAAFRSYSNPGDSFRDHGLFLRSNQRYNAAFRYSHDPDQFLYAIWKAGYATSPEYCSNVKAIMSHYQLYQYDRA